MKTKMRTITLRASTEQELDERIHINMKRGMILLNRGRGVKESRHVVHWAKMKYPDAKDSKGLKEFE